MDLRVNGGVSQRMLPRSQWREPLRDRVGAEQVHPCTTQTGGSDCGPEGQRSAPSGSRRAATGVRNNRRVCSETMEDHDRRFRHRWPLTWRSSHTFTVLNTTQFHVRRPDTDLARRKPGVQIPSPPPPTSQVRALSDPPDGAHCTLRPQHGRKRKSQSSWKGSQRPGDSSLGPT
jgi:hypothetical protein